MERCYILIHKQFSAYQRKQTPFHDTNADNLNVKRKYSSMNFIEFSAHKATELILSWFCFRGENRIESTLSSCTVEIATKKALRFLIENSPSYFQFN